MTRTRQDLVGSHVACQTRAGEPRRAITVVAFSLLLALVFGAAAHGQSDPSFVLKAGRVLPVADDLPWILEPGVIVVRDGRVESIGGSDHDVPYDLPVIEMPDATVMPGLVAATSSLGGAHRGDQSVSAAYRASNSFDRYGNYSSSLAGGVTTVHINPGFHRLLSGQGAVVRLGGPAAGRVLNEAADLTINLGDGASGPPAILELLVPPASDQVITPPQPQRPTTRMTQLLALKEAIEQANRDVSSRQTEGGEKIDIHLDALGRCWQQGMALRIHADQSIDLSAALTFLNSHNRPGYIVGGAEAAKLADQLASANIPLVYTVVSSFRAPGSNLGSDPTAIDPDVRDLVNLGALQFAIAPHAGQPLADMRLAAAFARRSGLDAERIIRAITIEPARILGIDDRVGSLSPGRDADLVVLSGDPLATSSHVHRVYVRGHLAYRQSQSPNATVIRGGTIWLGPNDYLYDGSILVEDGKIVEVGKFVSHPPHARVIDAGPDAFITPGLIDARGHLGLRGDRRSANPEFSLSRIIGAPDIHEHRVAQAGVTTVMLTPYGLANAGSQVTAIKTWGRSRADRVVRETAAVAFELGSIDHIGVAGRLRGRFDQARRYMEQWQKYEQELAEWKKKQAEGEVVEPAEPVEVEETVERRETDPISGVWDAVVAGGPIPEPVTGRVSLRLTGSSIEGRVVDVPVDVEHRIIGTLEGDRITGRIEVDTGGMGTPTFEANLNRADERIMGQISLAGFAFDVEMNRVERDADVRVVTRTRRIRDEEGRPTPPPVDESLEPLRAVLEKRIPVIIEANNARQVEEVLNFFRGRYDSHLLLANLDEPAVFHADRLRERGVGVILPTRVLTGGGQNPRHPGLELSRRGILFAFQSSAEDGARTLPHVGVFAVERGLSAERALAAMTIDAATMYRLDDRIGSIAAGRDADIVIFNGHPFDAGSFVRRVIINGEDVLP